MAMHGVSMSIGSADGLRDDYLIRLKALADRLRPLWVSDHLCWTGVDGFNSHDLLPLPYTEEALDVVCRNVRHAQDVLERALLLENPSSYLVFADDEMTEWEFIAEICRRSPHTVVVVYSKYEEWKDKVLGAGAAAFVVKPHIDELVDRIRQLAPSP